VAALRGSGVADAATDAPAGVRSSELTPGASPPRV